MQIPIEFLDKCVDYFVTTALDITHSDDVDDVPFINAVILNI